MKRIALLSVCFLVLLSIAPNAVASQKIVAISAGPFHCLALGDDGSVWEWGCNSRGELTGVRDNLPHEFPMRVPITNVTAVSAGAIYNIALKDDGTVWTWGLLPNEATGNLNGSFNIIQVPICNVTSICAGSNWAFAIKDDGSVWAWGMNPMGNFGNGESINFGSAYPTTIVPVQSIIHEVESISANSLGCFAIKDDGSVWAWGNNVIDSVGNNDYVIYGALGDFSPNLTRPEPFKVEMLGNVKSIYQGLRHVLVLKDDGTVWAWGNNYAGQLGDGNKTGLMNKNHTMIIVDYLVKSKIDDVKAISARSDISMALKNDGTVWTWGVSSDSATGSSTPTKVNGISDVISIGAGVNYYMAMKSDGSLWVWGDNHYGQAGVNGQLYQNTPIQVPFDYTINAPDAVIINSDALADQIPVATPVSSATPSPSTVNYNTVTPTANVDIGNITATSQQGIGYILQIAGLILLIGLIAGGIMLYKRK